jgi:ketosteroid isomerase-like protein
MKAAYLERSSKQVSGMNRDLLPPDVVEPGQDRCGYSAGSSRRAAPKSLLPIRKFLPRSASAFLAILFTIVSCFGQADSARTAILEANKKFEEAHLKGDAKVIAEQYTEDAQLLWEDRGIIRGRKAIEAEWRKDMGGPGRKATLTNLEIEQHGDWAYETSMFLVTDGEGRTIYDGKYICIWKRAGGEWKIHRDIGNKNRPAK